MLGPDLNQVFIAMTFFFFLKTFVDFKSFQERKELIGEKTQTLQNLT